MRRQKKDFVIPTRIVGRLRDFIIITGIKHGMHIQAENKSLRGKR